MPGVRSQEPEVRRKNPESPTPNPETRPSNRFAFASLPGSTPGSLSIFVDAVLFSFQRSLSVESPLALVSTSIQPDSSACADSIRMLGLDLRCFNLSEPNSIPCSLPPALAASQPSKTGIVEWTASRNLLNPNYIPASFRNPLHAGAITVHRQAKPCAPETNQRHHVAAPNSL
jgi:hypothetical protein